MTKRKRSPRSTTSNPLRPEPGHLTREAAQRLEADRMREIAALGTPRPPDVAAQSRAAAELAKRRGG
jgi:hypothetical protein